ncbi:peptidoglycan binding protein CsiV [Spongiibacter taiwanensis]
MPMSTLRLKITLGLLLILVLPVTVSAKEREFQIDLLVYANNDPSAAFSENWPDNLRLRYPSNWRALPPVGSTDREITRVATVAPEFAKTLKSMSLSSRYRKLIQASWRQTLTKRSRAPAIVIQGGDPSGEHFELEGYIKVAVERYLYISTDLWFTRFGGNGGNYYLPMPPYKPGANEPVEPDFDSLFAADDLDIEQGPDTADSGTASPAPVANATPINRIVVMNQERRLRSGELHFLDHPLFGVLVMISNADDLPPVEAAPQEPTP